MKMTNACFMSLIRSLSRSLREETIQRLLSGNDTQCFTTEQYAVMYNKKAWGKPTNDMSIKLARSSLSGMTYMVKEVKPDLWAAVVNEDQPCLPAM